MDIADILTSLREERTAVPHNEHFQTEPSTSSCSDTSRHLPSMHQTPAIRQSYKPRTHKRMDMASLDLYSQQRKKAGNERKKTMNGISMNGIVQALHSQGVSGGMSVSAVSQTQPKQVASIRPTTSWPSSQAVSEPTCASYSPNLHFSPVPSTFKKHSSNADSSQVKKTGRKGVKLTEEEKRQRQRQLVRKSYYRKIDTIKSLRSTVEELEQKYQSSLQHMRVTNTYLSSSASSNASTSSIASTEELREKYAQLSISKNQLRKENEELRAMAVEQSKVRTRLNIMMGEDRKEEAQELVSSPPRHEDEGVPSSAAILMKPMTSDECMRIACDAYKEAVSFRECESYETTGASVFGWTDRRHEEDGVFKFALEKTFKHQRMEDIAQKVWSLLSTEEGMHRVYSSNLRIRFHLVQRVDSSNVIFYRTIQQPERNFVLKALLLVSLVEVEQGYMLLFRSIDPAGRNIRVNPACTNPPATAEKEAWGEVTSWGLYERAGENGEDCHDFFGGAVPCSAVASVQFWMMQILVIAIRCEQEVVSSSFLMPS